MHFFKYSKKTHEKTQNSSKILKKLKPKFQKTQKPATPVELNWRKIVQKKPGYWDLEATPTLSVVSIPLSLFC